MTTIQAEKIARRKLSVLQLAQELGNVSKACGSSATAASSSTRSGGAFSCTAPTACSTGCWPPGGLTRTACRHRSKRRSWPMRWSTPHTRPKEPTTS